MALLLASGAAFGREVRVPLRFEPPFLRDVLEQELYTGPGNTAVVFEDDSGCARLTLASPSIEAKGGLLVVRTAADGLGGTSFQDWCVLPLRWQGMVELDLEPWVDRERSLLRFRVVASRFLPERVSLLLPTDTALSWVKSYVHGRVEEELVVELEPALEELGAVLPLFLREGDPSPRVERLALGGAEVAEGALVTWLQLEIVGEERAEQPGPEPALTPEEVESLFEMQQRWDAFLTFVSGEAARAASDAELRRELLAVLLDARQDLVEAAITPVSTARPDPVRTYFLHTWARLAPLLRRLDPAAQGASLRWTAFVAAGDALRAVDELGPATELDVSSDGLRRLARMLVAADFTADPLDYSEEVDPELRRSFDFGEPLELPPPEPMPMHPPEPTPETELVPPEPPPVSTPPHSRLDPSVVLVAAESTQGSDRLRGWVPKRSELDGYLELVRALLERSGEHALGSKPLAAEYRPLYRAALLATAWQETCWRHYVRRRGAIVVIRSSAGALGLMQVSPRVWRGFYDRSSLERDVAYNGRAGAEILMHYLTQYAIAREEHKHAGGTDNLARSAYAMYNGGPREQGRYRRAKPHPRERAVDQSFLDKYRAVKQGNLAVASCFGITSSS